MNVLRNALKSSKSLSCVPTTRSTDQRKVLAPSGLRLLFCYLVTFSFSSSSQGPRSSSWTCCLDCRTPAWIVLPTSVPFSVSRHPFPYFFLAFFVTILARIAFLCSAFYCLYLSRDSPRSIALIRKFCCFVSSDRLLYDGPWLVQEGKKREGRQE